jgi:hypothetical protein
MIKTYNINPLDQAKPLLCNSLESGDPMNICHPYSDMSLGAKL